MKAWKPPPSSGPADPRNPYGVTRPIDRMVMAAIFLRFGILPKQEVLDQRERQNDDASE